MTSDKIPSRTVMPCPFGGFGDDNIVQIGSVSGTDMNYPDGFPSAYGAPTENNGKFVLRKEMNALGKAATNDLFYHKCGGLNTFDADFCAAVGGYPKGAVLQMVDGYSVRSVMSLIDNNKVCFTGQTLTDAQKNVGLVNGDVDSISWIYLNEEKTGGLICKTDFSITQSQSIIASFIAPRSGKIRIAATTNIAFNESTTNPIGNVYPSLYNNGSAGILLAKQSSTLKFPSTTSSTIIPSGNNITTITTVTADWNSWKLTNGSVSLDKGYSKDTTSLIYRISNTTPDISDFSVTAEETYLLLAIAGTSYSVLEKNITFYTVTYSGEVEVFLQ